MPPLRHIAIEGPIGVGKSTLAQRLAAHFDAELLLEKPEENPFLARFYADGSRYALQTQLFFLFQRVEQYRRSASRACSRRASSATSCSRRTRCSRA